MDADVQQKCEEAAILIHKGMSLIEEQRLWSSNMLSDEASRNVFRILEEKSEATANEFLAVLDEYSGNGVCFEGLLTEYVDGLTDLEVNSGECSTRELVNKLHAVNSIASELNIVMERQVELAAALRTFMDN